MADLPDPWTIARAELAPDERLIWADRPLPRATERRATGIIAFGMVLALVALYWTAQAWAAGLAIAWVGLPFMALGIGFAISPWWRGPRAGLVYAVTDRRLLILRGGPKPRVRSFGPADLKELEVQERPDGSGDLIFQRRTVLVPAPVDEESRRRAMPRIRHIGFFAIHDVRRVAAAVRKLKETGGPAPSAHPKD